MKKDVLKQSTCFSRYGGHVPQQWVCCVYFRSNAFLDEDTHVLEDELVSISVIMARANMGTDQHYPISEG